MKTLQEALRRATEAETKGIHFLSRGQLHRRPYPELARRAARVAGFLRERGVEPGDRVALVFSNSPVLVDAVLGALLARAAPMCLPLPMRLGRLEEYRTSLERMLEASTPRLVLAQQSLVRFLPPSVAALPFGDDTASEAPPLHEDGRAEDLALLQFSSGTTSHPRPVALLHRNIVENAKAILSTFPGRLEDHLCVSWLPLHHDMGMIGTLFTALVAAGDLVLMRPEEFVARPASWLEGISRLGATVSPAPNFALNQCVQRVRDEDLEGLDLSRWTMALVGAEPVQRGTLERFAKRFERCGFRAEALTPVYGLAEATLAVTFSAVGEAPRFLEVDPMALASDGSVRPVAGGRSLACLGRPLPGLEVEVRGPRQVGAVHVQGPSVMAGYFGQPESTARALHGEWLDTGDLGFLHEGDLYLCGRARDVLIVHGRNHDPGPVEEAVDGVDGLRADRAAAISVEDEESGTEALLLLVEESPGQARETADLAREACEAVIRRTGLSPREVHVLQPGSLPLTSSGKMRRSEARRLLLEGLLAEATRGTFLARAGSASP